MTELRYHTMPDGRRIAFRFSPGSGPTLVFLPGYMSDMSGSKAQAVFDWALTEGRACLLLDYSGCGQSSGAFADGTLSRWADEVVALIETHCPGPAVLVGSSMGGWLMLIVALRLGARVTALVGIAPAPDFVEWGIGEVEKAELAAGHTVLAENPYGPEPTPTHPGFWSDAQAHVLLAAPIAYGGPVRLLHGQADADVPWEISIRLAAALRSADVQVHLNKQGDHRLSRAEDIAMLLHAIATLPPGQADPI